MRKREQGCVRRVWRFASLLSILVILETQFVPQAFAEASEVLVIIPGVTDSLPDGAIIADSFSWGAAATAPASSSGLSGGVSVHDFQIKKKVDTTSPSFFKNCVSGAHYSKVTINVKKSGSGGQEFLQFTLTNVTVSSIHFGGSQGSEEPEETITFAYASLGVTYLQQGSPNELDCTRYPLCIAQLPR